MSGDENKFVSFPVSAVLPAGGCGERFGTEIPKQFCNILNQPLFLHSLLTFHRIKWIENIIVTVPPRFEEEVKGLVSEFHLERVTVVVGGSTRHRSIYLGIKAVKKVCSSPCVVLIHDAVRVFVDEDTVRQVALAAKQHGAAGVMRPLISTVIVPDSAGMLKESLDRSKYRNSEMPQGFQYEVIKEAYEKSTDFDFDYGTECLLLAMKYTGTKARIIEGPSNLWKVTYRKDLHAAEGMLKENNICVRFCCMDSDILKEQIIKKCQSRNIQCGKGEDSANTTICRYNKIDFTAIRDNTYECMKHVQEVQEHVTYVQVKCCVIHVIQDPSATMEQYCNLTTNCLDLVRNLRTSDLLVYVLLDQDPGDPDRVSEMVVSVLWDRNESLSGQVFLISQTQKSTAS